jgi:hypothetical protein
MGSNLMGGAVVQVVGQCQQADPNHGIKDFSSAMSVIMTQGDRAHHHAQSQTADRNRHDIAVVEHAAPQSEEAQGNSDSQPYFMDQRIEEHAARRGQERDKGNGRDTMRKTQAGNEHGDTVPQAIPDHQTVSVPEFRCRKHDSPSRFLFVCGGYRKMLVKIQHIILDMAHNIHHISARQVFSFRMT